MYNCYIMHKIDNTPGDQILYTIQHVYDNMNIIYVGVLTECLLKIVHPPFFNRF